MTSNDDYILEILENVGLISREQAVAARQIAAQDDEPVMNVLARDGGVSKLDMLKALAGQFGMETITLTGLEIPQEVLDLVPGEVSDAGEDFVSYRMCDGSAWTNDAREEEAAAC